MENVIEMWKRIGFKCQKNSSTISFMKGYMQGICFYLDDFTYESNIRLDEDLTILIHMTITKLKKEYRR